MICASEILPGPAIIITIDDASKIKSSSTPPSPVKLWAPLTKKMAPNIMIDINDADNLLRTPITNKIPGINSAKAIGICISAGNPMFDKKLVNQGLNLPIPWTIKITPIADLMPIKTTSLSSFSLISLVANETI